MMVIFLSGAQGKVHQHQNNFKSTNSVRAAHTKKTRKTCGQSPHSTFIYEAVFEFRFTLPSSATE
jgi:hypothetical protein